MENASDITSSSTSSVNYSTSVRCSQILRSSLRLSRSAQCKNNVHAATAVNDLNMREKTHDKADSLEKGLDGQTAYPTDIPHPFVRQTFQTASLTRPMCRICHDCSGYEGPPIPNVPPSCSSSSVSLPRSVVSRNSGQGDREGDQFGKLINPCLCDGSLKYIHEVCIQQWIAVSHSKQCELCHYEYEMRSFTKPFLKWHNLPLLTMERRRLMCSVVFHILAIICVVWSLYVLIERIIDEVINEDLSWQFWTKIVVVAVGLAGAIVFSYVQCRLYYELIVRWRDHNRVFLVQVPSEESLKKAKEDRSAAVVPTSNIRPPPAPRSSSQETNDAVANETSAPVIAVRESEEQVPTSAMP